MHLSKHLLPWLVVLAFAAPVHAEDARFDVAVTDARARPFFEGLAEGTPYNIVLEPGVSGSITLTMRNVTVPEVLEAVREAYGYDYRRLPSGFVITPPAMQTRLFQVNYIDLERRGTSRTRVSSGQMGQNSRANGVNGQAGGNNGSGESSNGLSEPPGEVFSGRAANGQNGDRVREITGTSISTRTSSDFWHELEDSLHALVPGEGGRAIIVNAQSGVIAVRATPRELRDVDQYLKQIQSIATRQVILETKILEVELSDGFQAGINWNLIGHDGASLFGGGQTGPQNGFGSSDMFNQPSKAVTLGGALGNTVTNTLGGAFTMAVKAADFNAFIELLSTQGKTRVLSSPRVSTLNNQKAVIKAGSDEYFVTGVSSNTVVGTASATNRDVDLAPFFSGIALDVTPQIGADGEVIMHIHPTVSDVSEKVKQLTVAGVTDALPLAFSQVRESDSVVKAGSGQLIVIGGLMRTSRTYQDYRTPLLGDIPGVGNLFKSQRRREVRTELVILLRPVVVEDDAQWRTLAAEPVDRATAIDPKAASGVR
ncbi:MAG: pilus (MSHA type) biogenesis protein MshL [Steroidobacteraceae bacterium]